MTIEETLRIEVGQRLRFNGLTAIVREVLANGRVRIALPGPNAERVVSISEVSLTADAVGQHR